MKTPNPKAAPSRAEIVAMATISTETEPPAASNDNASPTPVPDTTHLVAHRDVVRYIGATLRRYRVRARDMPDAIAEVQTDAIEAARTKRMPASLAEWKGLTATIAARRAVDRRREAKARAKYDAGLCDDADAYARPTLHWEHRDPVDTKRYLTVLKELFDSGQMPEHGAEILWGEADEVPHEEIAAELGISLALVDTRLSRMRARFRARLAALGLLTLMLLVLALFSSSALEVASPAPQTIPDEHRDAATWEDGGTSLDTGRPR